MEIPVRNVEGQEVERLQFDLACIDSRERPRLLKEAVVMYMANRRVGTHSTKTRSEVAGSGRKPWRQKGTGRARAGTRKSPLWKGGGTVFGPHPRDYSLRMNKKQRRRALLSALFCKFRDGEVHLVDRIDVSQPKTRAVAQLLKAHGIGGSCLIGVASHDRNLVLSARNIPGVRLLPVSDFNVLEVLRAKTILLTRDAFERLTAHSQQGEESGKGEREVESRIPEAAGEEA